MQIKSSADNSVLNYCYRADGGKFSALDADKTGLIYIGSLVYKQTAGSKIEFESAAFSDGRFRKSIHSWVPDYAPEYYLKDHLGSPRALCDCTGELIALRDYYPFGKQWDKPNAPVTTDLYHYNGKEEQTVGGAGLLDYGARFYHPDLGRWLTQDPMANLFTNIGPYAFCGNSPICYIDPDGLAWKPTYIMEPDGKMRCTGYEWVDEEDAYDENGPLRDGIYNYAIFCSDNGTFDPLIKYNIGSSTITVYLPDGTTITFDGCTTPSGPDYATVPEGFYHATKGMHNGSNGSYTALRLSDVNNSGKIELGGPNPAHPDRTYADGINMHKPGKGNFTGQISNGSPISAGCLLVDRNRWDEFIGIFDSCQEGAYVIGVAVSRSLSAPLNVNILPAFNFFLSGTRRDFLK